MATARRCSIGLLVTASSVLVLGCHATQPHQADVGLTEVRPPRNPDLGRGAPRETAEQRYRILLGEDVGGICAGPAPYFDTANSKTESKSIATMQTLAECMISGPLRGKSIVLVGHTDPRGSAEYNDRLGAKRAAAVRNYLIDHGIAADRVKIETAGERTASSDPKDWATDRRVEVRVDESRAKTMKLETER